MQSMTPSADDCRSDTSTRYVLCYHGWMSMPDRPRNEPAELCVFVQQKKMNNTTTRFKKSKFALKNIKRNRKRHKSEQISRWKNLIPWFAVQGFTLNFNIYSTRCCTPYTKFSKKKWICGWKYLECRTGDTKPFVRSVSFVAYCYEVLMVYHTRNWCAEDENNRLFLAALFQEKDIGWRRYCPLTHSSVRRWNLPTRVIMQTCNY